MKIPLPALHSTVPEREGKNELRQQQRHRVVIFISGFGSAADSPTINITRKKRREREWKSFMNKKNAGTYHKVLIYFTVNETFMVALSPSNRHGGWKERHKKNKKLFQLILRWLLYMIHLAFNSTRHVFFLMREIEMID